MKDAADGLLEKERQPAENEAAHDHAEHFGRLAFTFDIDLLAIDGRGRLGDDRLLRVRDDDDDMCFIESRRTGERRRRRR